MRESNKFEEKDKVVCFEKSSEKQRLIHLLFDAERESVADGKHATHREVMKKMRDRIAAAEKRRRSTVKIGSCPW